MTRALVALVLGAAAGIFGFTAGMGLGGSPFAGGAVAALAAGLVVHFGRKRWLVWIDEAAASRGLRIVSAVATLVALGQLGRLAVFMVDPAQVACSFMPSSRWELEHSCLSAYYVAADAAATRASVYDDALYSLPDDNPAAPRRARMLGPFKIDVFEYPPPFLLLPRALQQLVPDFLRLRMVWFALSGGVVLATMLVVARLLGPGAGTRALLLSPLVWMALPTLGTLQKGNVQLLVIAASVLAMALFERRRSIAGGALLAFATVSKLYPGLLILYLMARRQWRAVFWTAGLAIVFNLLTLVDLGWGVYRAFLEHLPGLLGGEAFPAFRNPAAMAINFSIPGLVFKLKLFGFPALSFPEAKVVGWIYTLVAVAATVVVARRARTEAEQPLAWLAVVILATLRSPFLPQAYAVFPVLWLLTLHAARRAPTSRTLAWVIGAWLALCIYWPIDRPLDPRWLAFLSGIPQALTIALVVLTLRSRSEVAATAGATSDEARLRRPAPQ